jgi:hypothetical protein
MAISITITLGTTGVDITGINVLESATIGGTYTAVTGESNVSPASFPRLVSNINDASTYIKLTTVGVCSEEQVMAITDIPTPPATSNSFTNTNGPAKLYPQPNLLNTPPNWSISLKTTSGATNNTIKLNPTPVTYANTPWNPSGGTTGDYAEINMGTGGTTTSTLDVFKITFQILASPSGGLTAIDTLQITDGTTNYPGTGTKIGSFQYEVSFNIGTEKGRTFRWGSTSSIDPGNVQIGNGN